MTTITREEVKAFIEQIESDLSNGWEAQIFELKLARIALAALEAEPVASCIIEDGGMCVDGFGEYVGHSLPDGTHQLYAAPPAPVDNEFIPKNLDKALGVVGVALPESKEEFNFQTERWIQRLIDRVIRYANEFKEQPVPVVPDEWTIQDAVKFCRETGRQDAGSAMEAWNACRAAMLNAEPLHATPKGNRLRIAEGKLAEYSLSKREPQPTPESADRKMLKRLAVIMSGSDSGGEISALTVTAQSLVDRCKALALSTSQEPQPLTLANETMDVERLREIAEEDNGSDVKFECSVMARMLLSVALNSDPVAYTDAEELESLEGVDGHSYAHLWPNSYGFGKDIALYTVPQMMPLPVNILDDETNRDVFEAWVADYTGHTKGFVRQFRVDDKYRSDSMWNKYWNTWNACRTAMLNGGKS